MILNGLVSGIKPAVDVPAEQQRDKAALCGPRDATTQKQCTVSVQCMYLMDLQAGTKACSGPEGS